VTVTKFRGKISLVGVMGYCENEKCSRACCKFKISWSCTDIPFLPGRV